MKEGEDISFDELLTNLSITEQNYYLAIRSSLHSPTIFLKSSPHDMKEGEDISFDELLTNLSITEQNYYLAIRSSLHSPTIFLKRSPNELRVNNYNSACLSAWRANMDIQFVLDVYACAMYIQGVH